MTSVAPWLLAIAIVVAVNPLRLQGRLPGTRVTAVGALVAFVVYLAMGAVATGLLDAIEVSAPTMRVAAGLVLILGAARDLLMGPPSAEPSLPGDKAALVPVALPMLIRPHVAVLAVSVGASDGLAPLALGTVVMAVVAVWMARPIEGVEARWVGWLGVAASVTAVCIGVALAVEGVFSV